MYEIRWFAPSGGVELRSGHRPPIHRLALARERRAGPQGSAHVPAGRRRAPLGRLRRSRSRGRPPPTAHGLVDPAARWDAEVELNARVAELYGLDREDFRFLMDLLFMTPAHAPYHEGLRDAIAGKIGAKGAAAQGEEARTDNGHGRTRPASLA